MNTANIEVDPDPPQKGKSCEISHTGSKPVTLRYQLDPPGTGWVEITLTTNDPTYELKIPANALALAIEDLTGGAPARDLPCE